MCSRVAGCNLSGLSDQQIQSRLRSDPRLTMELGVEYFKQGLSVTGGNVRNTLAYYNGGPRALNKSKTCSGKLWWECEANSGYLETRNYVRNILGTEQAGGGGIKGVQ